jgi:hypothetical protein
MNPEIFGVPHWPESKSATARVDGFSVVIVVSK